MQADAVLATDVDDSPLRAIESVLSSENEVLRSAAMRAMAAFGVRHPDALRKACLVALKDPDPDLRSDAMTALITVARPEDAATVRYSLELDPVREVKLAAIAILAILKDPDAEDLLRALVLSRSEDLVAWEDQDSDWEDWLDVQIAAIKALGQMDATHAIADILTARDDEFGQSLDIAVFETLGQLGDEGIATLIRILDGDNAQASRRAAMALVKVDRAHLRPHLDALLVMPEVALRLLALSLLDKGDPRGPALAEVDPDPSVRVAALHQFAPAAPDLILRGLSDEDETVRAAALALTKPPFDDALVPNMVAWLDICGPRLATAICDKLPLVDTDKAPEILTGVVGDPRQPLTVRIAAMQALADTRLAMSTDALVAFLASPAQQIRAVVLTALASRAAGGDAVAQEVLARAIAGTELADEHAQLTRDTPDDSPDFGVPKEGSGPPRIRISRDGDIIPADADMPVESGQSTLDAILAGADAPRVEMAGDTPEESAGKRRKRRPIEGSDQIASSLAADAMRISRNLDAMVVKDAVIDRLSDPDDLMRRVAWEAIGQGRWPVAVSDLARVALHDPDPVVRGAAFDVVLGQDEAMTSLALKDDDPLIRLRALHHLPLDQVLEFVVDPVLTVRDAAARRLLAGANSAVVSDAVQCLAETDYPDTLRQLFAGSEAAREAGLALLKRQGVTPHKVFVILTGFADHATA